MVKSLTLSAEEKANHELNPELHPKVEPKVKPEKNTVRKIARDTSWRPIKVKPRV